jgi:AcrR family transcriptional regulator
MGVVSMDSGLLVVSDRERILQAMAECCAEGGYAETTVEAVLDRAGVALESFRQLFAGKEDCALAALNKIISEALAQIAMANEQAIDVVQKRKSEVTAVLELLSARPSFAHLAYIDARQGGTAQMHEAYEAAIRVLALMMERSIATTGAPSTAARAALGGAEAVLRKEIAAGRTQQLPALLGDFVYAALVPFVGQEEALRQSRLAVESAAEKGWR